MAEFITLTWFGAQARHYHVYRIKGSALSHQPHYHNYYQVCFVLRGEILHGQGEGAVTLSAGDAFIVPPGFVHSLHFGNAAAEVYSLAFAEALFSPGFSGSGAFRFMHSLRGEMTEEERSNVRLRVMLDGERRKSMQSLLDTLIRQQADACPPELSAAPGIVEAILYLLAQSYYSQPQNRDDLDRLMSYSNTIQQCIAFVNAHYKDPLTSEELARQFGLSRSAFCMVFPRFAGAPLRQYVANKRIEEAQMLIRSHPGRSLSAIGRDVGYVDDVTFYRNFVRVTGLSPAKYRSLNDA